MANSYPSEWVAALDKAEKMDVDVYVPAHASLSLPALLTGRDELHMYRLALERVAAEGRRLYAAGVRADDAVSQANFGEFGAWTRLAENAPAALKRVYMELDGQLPTPVR
jgi:hypothetical protein